MRIGLHDVDGHNFPNLPLMKLSAWHKARGDAVEWWIPLERYDIVYKSKVFTFTPDPPYQPQANCVIEGGTGYGKNENLPDEVEHMMPDYSIYPQFSEAYGFLTRGCPRGCPWCIVKEKEGATSHRVANLGEFWSGQKTIKLLDPNMLACAEHIEILGQLEKSGAFVDFTQGLDIRLVTEENAEILKRIRVKNIHFAWDNPKEDLTKRFESFKITSGITDYRKLGVYILTNFNSTHEEGLHRINTLRELGYSPYVMIFDKENAPRQTRLLQRWVNNRIIFATVKNFAEYNAKRG